MKHILRSRAIDNFCIDLCAKAKVSDTTRLTAHELKALKKPQRVVTLSLDEKLIIANKLGKKAFIVLIDENEGINHKQFSQMFRQPFLDEKNRFAIDEMEKNGLVVIANETVGRFIQRAELFMNSDLYELAKVVRRIKNKNSVQAVLDTEDNKIKELFTYLLMRITFAIQSMKEYMETLGISQREFLAISTLYLMARPMTSDEIIKYVNKNIKKLKTGLQKGAVAACHHGYVDKMEAHSSHKITRTFIYTLTPKGHTLINDFIKKVTTDALTNTNV